LLILSSFFTIITIAVNEQNKAKIGLGGGNNKDYAGKIRLLLKKIKKFPKKCLQKSFGRL